MGTCHKVGVAQDKNGSIAFVGVYYQPTWQAFLDCFVSPRGFH